LRHLRGHLVEDPLSKISSIVLKLGFQTINLGNDDFY